MKKSIIAAGAASVALAAMPMVGVFAAQGDGNLQDTIKVNISESCSISRKAGETEGVSNAHTGGSGDNAGTWGQVVKVPTH